MEALRNYLQPLLELIPKYDVGGVNTRDIAVAAVILLIFLVAFRIFRAVILTYLEKLAKKSETDLDDAVVEMLEKIPAYFYWIVSAYIAFRFLHFENPLVKKIVTGVFVVFVVLQSILFLQRLLKYALTKSLAKNEENETAIHGVSIFANIAIWLIGILLVLQNLGFEVSTLVASLGIGGVAIAFALQNILGDLFSSFAIYFDKPFKVGDYVVLGTDSGTVKKIGMKTTRITTLQGEELVVSNTELTSTRIKNFKRMKKRRVAFPFGVVYGTKSKKLQKIPGIVKKIIDKEKLGEFERCHFKSFGDFSLNYEVVYYVLNREYMDYMDTQQSINLKIKDAFEKEKIEMAFPTQTIYLQK